MKGDKILLVDDEREVTDALLREIRTLCHEEGLFAQTASSAAEALEALDQGGEVAVLVSDLKMPGLKGGDFLRVVSDRWPETVPLVLTGHAELDNVQDFLDAGVQAFLTKPWDRRRLTLELRRALQVHDSRRREREHRAFVEAELLRAKNFQDQLFRGQIPRDPRLGVDFHVANDQDFEFGGDFVDLRRIDDHRYVLIMADVAGHSLDASYVVALIRAIIESDLQPYLESGPFSPSEFAEWFNRKLCRHKPGGDTLFVALMAMEFDLEAEEIRWVNAGQPPFVLEAQAGNGASFVSATTAQYPLGVFERSAYREEMLPFPIGARLMMVTDRIRPEGMNLIDYAPERYLQAVKQCLRERLGAAEAADLLCRSLSLDDRSGELSLALIEHVRPGR